MPSTCPECGELAYPHLRAGHAEWCGLAVLGALAWSTHAPGWHLLWLLRLTNVLIGSDSAAHGASPAPKVS